MVLLGDEMQENEAKGRVLERVTCFFHLLLTLDFYFPFFITTQLDRGNVGTTTNINPVKADTHLFLNTREVISNRVGGYLKHIPLTLFLSFINWLSLTLEFPNSSLHLS